MRLSLLLAAVGAVAALLAFAYFVADSGANEGEEVVEVRAPGARRGASARDEPGLQPLELAPAPPLPADPPDPPGEEGALTTWSIHGRCLAEGTDEPLAAISVLVACPGEPVGRASTDETGHFALPYRGRDEVYAWPLPGEGWVPAGSRVRLRMEQLRGEEETVLQLARGLSSAVTGQVLDKATGEAVPALRVDVTHGASELEDAAVTDDAGWFATEVSFPPGEVLARMFDEPPGEEVPVGTFKHQHLEAGTLGTAWMLEVDVGPTTRVAPATSLFFPPGVWSARIVERGPRGRYAAVLLCHDQGFQPVHDANPIAPEERAAQAAFLAELEKLGVGEEPATGAFADANAESRIWPWIPLREGTTRWVRYPNRLYEPEASLLPTLELRDSGGQWLGEESLTSTIGIHPEVVAVALRPNASVSGRVLNKNGWGARDVEVLLDPRGDPDDRPPYVEVTDDTGGFEFKDVLLGDYVLEYRPEYREGDIVAVRVLQGGNPLLPFYVRPHGARRDLSGELLAHPDAAGGRPIVRLEPVEGTSYRAVSFVERWYRYRTPHRASFGFPDVPEGTYDVFVSGYATSREGAPAAWGPRRIRTSGRRRDLEFHARDVAPVPHVVRPMNRTGFILPNARVVFGPEGWLQGEFALGAGVTFPVAAGSSLDWTVFVPDYRPAHGTDADFAVEGGEHVAEARLEPGWGATLHLRRQLENREEAIRYLRLTENREMDGVLFHMAPPVIGAEVRADGRYVGRTDRRGRIEVSLRHRPRYLTIEKEGWSADTVTALGWGDVAPRHVSVVWLKPEE